MLDNLQVICANCHTQKTTLECLSIVEDDNPLLSRFSLETYAAFVESAKPPQAVAHLRQLDWGAISVDVWRCRYSAFVEQDAYELPVFSPCDDVRSCSN